MANTEKNKASEPKEVNENKTDQTNNNIENRFSYIEATLGMLIEQNKMLAMENEKLKANASDTVREPTEEELLATERMMEKVPIYLFKGSGKYARDVNVTVNGKTYQIKRGVQVMVPRFVYDIVKRSEAQDAATEEMISKMEAELADKEVKYDI